MKIIAKMVTGEVFESRSIYKSGLTTELCELADRKVEEYEVREVYDEIVELFTKDFKNLTYLSMTLPDGQDVFLNPAHVVWTKVLDPITDWGAGVN